MLYRNASCRNKRSRKIICSAFIQCYFDYVCSFWYCLINKQLKNRLQITQKKEVRFILSLSPKNIIFGSILNYLNILSVEDRVVQKDWTMLLICIMTMHQHILIVLNDNSKRSATIKNFIIAEIGNESSCHRC